MTRYVFDHWEVDGVDVGSANPMTLTDISANISIVAIYGVITHIVSVDSVPGGVTFIQPALTVPFTVPVQDGGSITLQAPTEIDV